MSKVDCTALERDSQQWVSCLIALSVEETHAGSDHDPANHGGKLIKQPVSQQPPHQHWASRDLDILARPFLELGDRFGEVACKQYCRTQFERIQGAGDDVLMRTCACLFRKSDIGSRVDCTQSFILSVLDGRIRA